MLKSRVFPTLHCILRHAMAARAIVSTCLFGMLLTLSAPSISHAADQQILVQLDQAKILQLPEKTATVVIGNPGIADVTFVKRTGNLILTGKSYGQTNMIALDATGTALSELQVRVAAGPGALIVQNGDKRVSYSCSPRCQPTFSLGDDATFTGQVTGQVQSRNSFASPTGK